MTDIWLIDELEGAHIDLEECVTPTAAQLAALRRLRPADLRDCTIHRLENDWQGHRAGTLVLYDGQEVLYFCRIDAPEEP